MQIRKHAENCFCNSFCLSGLLNSLSKKVVQISFFNNVLLRQLSFTTNTGPQINSHSDFLFIQHVITWEKHTPYYIFLLLEGNEIYM